MENEHPIEPASGSTSPTFPKSITSGETPADGSHDDTTSVTSAETASATTAFIVPAPPANTPATQSVVDGMTNLDLSGARDALAALPGAVTLGTSEMSNASSTPVDAVVANGTADRATNGAKEGVQADGKGVEEGKAHLRVPVRSDIPLLRQLFKAPPKLQRKAKRGWKRAKKVVGVDVASRSSTPKPKKGDHDVSPPNEHVHEHSVWEDVAREDLNNAINRTKQYALDMVRINDARAVEDYYSELLADAVNKGDLKFDKKYLE